MEKIKKALEQARKESNSFAAATPDTTLSAKDTPDPVKDIANIKYSKTKVVNIPRKVQVKNHLISCHNFGPEVDAYKVLRANVIRNMKAKNWKTLAVTSARPKEGKSLTAINLAITLAKEVNHTVLLADFDLRKPRVHQFFDYYPKYGLSEVINGEVKVEDVLINPSIPRLVILPGNNPINNSSEALSSPALVRMVKELKSKYTDRYIIFDMPSVLEADDTLVFADYVDAYLLVIEDGKTSEHDLRRVFDMLGVEKLLGTVLNKSEEAKHTKLEIMPWKKRLLN